jgi:hypothetical protein
MKNSQIKNRLPRFQITPFSAPDSFETIEQHFLPGQVLLRHCSLVKAVRDASSTTRVANSGLHLANRQLMGRSPVSSSYNNNGVRARRDGSCVPDPVRASLVCSNNLHTAQDSFQDLLLWPLGHDWAFSARTRPVRIASFTNVLVRLSLRNSLTV